MSAATLIDVHAHIVPAGFPATPASCSCGRWPAMAPRDRDRAAVVIGGKDFRIVDSRSWDPARRVAELDAEDIALQVLSPMPELLSHWLDAQSALVMCRHVNGVIGEMVAAAPDRFAGFGMVPMQNPELAARELGRLRADYGLRGIEVGSHIDGRSPADPIFDVVWAEAERLDLCVFVHALHPIGVERLVGPPGLAPFVAFPLDTSLAATGFITAGIPARFPKLKVMFSHGGGALAAVLPRLSFGWRTTPVLQSAFADPVAAARTLFYDSLVYDSAWLRHLIATFGASQLMMGTDYPFAIRQPLPGLWLEAAELDAEVADGLRSGNARRFLGL
ncbi:MAG: amidohydrolase [Caulobacteraceae bacterium]|nr:amidohydrolase [Caulobacteraceae bacterium]